jgi:hypothetical protein
VKPITATNPAPNPWRSRRTRWLALVPLVSGLVLWLPYARLAGFDYDDWAIVAKYTFNLGPPVSFRPGFVLWAPLSVRLMGLHVHWYYASTEVIFALSATAVFVVLVSLRVPTMASLSAAVLYVVYPGADAARLWWTASENSLAILLVLLSVFFGVKWSEGRGWSVKWLIPGLACLAAGVLVYEEAAVLILLPLATLPMSATVGRRALKTALDLPIVAICFGLILKTNGATGVQAIRPLDQFPSRAQTVFVDGFHAIFVRMFAGAPAWAIGGIPIVFLAFVAAGLIIRSKVRPCGAPSWARSAMVSGLLFAAVFLAWVPLLPANDYYLPSLLGIGNRVNSTASVFLCAGLGIAFFSMAALVSRAGLPVIGHAVAAALLFFTLATFIVVSVADASSFVRAAQQRQAMLQVIKRAVPNPAHGDLLVLSNYNAFSGPNWVPVFAASWDFNGAVKLLYNDPSLAGSPLFPSFSCVASGLQLAPGTIVSYSRVDLINSSTGMKEPMGSAAGCTRIIASESVRLFP